MDFKDYYKILEVDKKASTDDIKKSYRNLARKYHPDTNKSSDAENKFKNIQEAYEVLKDPEKRQKYDMLGANWNRHRQTGGTSDNFNWNDWFTSNPNAGKRHRPSGFQTVGDFFNSGGGLSDFFERIFGSQFNRQSDNFRGTTYTTKPTKGDNLEAEVEISLEEAFKGASRLVTINNQKIEVKFKPGINTGQTLKIPGKGKPSKSGGEYGDLLLKVVVSEHPKYIRKGNDLEHDVTIDLYTALLGGSVNIRTFAGTVKLNVPPETQNGKTLKLKGQGMPIYSNPTQRGDLFIKIHIKIPTNLKNDEIELFKKLKEMRK